MLNEEPKQCQMVEIHTSDRIAFKRCRRRWEWTSPLRMHLEPKDKDETLNLWLGSGVHFAFEDYHGYNRFGIPSEALTAYYEAFRPSERPIGADEAIELGIRMLDYYLIWYNEAGRPKYETLWLEGKPQVEVEFRLELTNLSEKYETVIVYHGTFDRVVKNEEGLWVEDYKTARAIDFHRLATDPQMKAYTWAAEQVFSHPFEGALMLQLSKSPPSGPKQLKTGGYSVAKDQRTTHGLYRAKIVEAFGSVPEKYRAFIDHLAMEETPEGNRFMRRDKIHHNDHVKQNTYSHILAESDTMLNPDIAIYPNETMNCSWDCGAFRNVCIAKEEGGDWEELLVQDFQKRKEENKTWRSKIKWPLTSQK